MLTVVSNTRPSWLVQRRYGHGRRIGFHFQACREAGVDAAREYFELRVGDHLAVRTLNNLVHRPMFGQHASGRVIEFRQHVNFLPADRLVVQFRAAEAGYTKPGAAGGQRKTGGLCVGERYRFCVHEFKARIGILQQFRECRDGLDIGRAG